MLGAVMGGEEGLLFLKKKKQKDFCPMASRRCNLGATHQMAKVFWFFFSKKNRFPLTGMSR